MATKPTNYRYLTVFMMSVGTALTLVALLGAAAQAQEVGVIQSYSGAIPENAPHYADFLVRTLPDGAVTSGRGLADRVIERYGKSPLPSSLSPLAVENLKQKLVRQLETGRRKFLEGEYRGAIESLLAGLKELTNHPELLCDSQALLRSRRDAFLYLAQAYLRVRMRTKAAEIMRQAIRLDPDGKVSKATFSPDLIRLHQKTQRRMHRLPRHSLQVIVRGNASVYVNGRFIGGAPAKVGGLLPGRYSIYAKNDEARSAVHVVELNDRNRKLTIDLGLENRLETSRYVGLRFSMAAEQKAEELPRTITLTNALGLRKMIMLRHDKYQGRKILAGKVYDASAKTWVRRGFVYLDLTDTPERKIRDLGRFLLNGEKSPSIQMRVARQRTKNAPKRTKKVPEDPPSENKSLLRVFSWVSLGVAVAAAGASVPLFILDGEGSCSGTARCPEKYDTLAGGIALAASAGAAAIASGILFYYAYGKSEAPRVSVLPRLRRDSVGLDAAFRF